MTGGEGTGATVANFLQLSPLPAARDAAAETRKELDALLSEGIPNYTSEEHQPCCVRFTCQGEWTSGSDLDWTYLIDGQANSDHLLIAQKIQSS
jgi:hypothetical protein